MTYVRRNEGHYFAAEFYWPVRYTCHVTCAQERSLSSIGYTVCVRSVDFHNVDCLRSSGSLLCHDRHNVNTAVFRRLIAFSVVIHVYDSRGSINLPTFTILLIIRLCAVAWQLYCGRKIDPPSTTVSCCFMRRFKYTLATWTFDQLLVITVPHFSVFSLCT